GHRREAQVDRPGDDGFAHYACQPQNMNRWRVKYLTLAEHAVAEQDFEAATSREVEESLRRMGRVVLQMRAARQSRSPPARSLSGRLAIALFAEELKALLDAGLNLVEALKTLVASMPESHDQLFVSRILSRVQEGKSLSEAMAADDPAIPRVLV